MNCFNSHGLPTEQCLQVILQTVAEGILVCDTQATIRFANRSMEHLTGYTLQEIAGKNARDIIICPDVRSLEQPSDNIECSVLRKDGRTIPVLRNTRPIYDHQQRIGVVATFSDITLLKQTQQRLSQFETTLPGPQGFEGIIGKSHVMREVFKLIDLAAASNATVLITGETGTGKELAARAIHHRGQRRDAPFIAVNCSALPESLLESELFGHSRGSFTGAIHDKVGRFEAADGGTLFLDEVGEISPLIQVKLLRFLQQREFERVGESQTRKADVRIIAATNRDLRALTRSGEFRDDLFYRLKVFPIYLPPLRERKEDVGPLVRHFISRFNRETGKNLTGLTHDASLTLMDYCWPGNVRELENAIEHAFVTCRRGDIDLFDLPLEIRRVELRQGICSPAAPSPANPAPTVSPAPIPPIPSRSLTRETIIAALQAAAGNRTAAARSLGVDRTTLWRNMKRLGIGTG